MRNFKKEIYKILNDIVDTYEGLIPLDIAIDDPIATYNVVEVYDNSENGKKSFLFYVDIWANEFKSKAIEDCSDTISVWLNRLVIKTDKGFIKLIRSAPHKRYIFSEDPNKRYVQIELIFDVLYMN